MLRFRMSSWAFLIAALLMCSVEAQTEYQPDLFGLARVGRTPDIEAAVAAGADIEERDEWGQTPLLLASIAASWPEIVEAFISVGADIEARDRQGFTPLLAASLSGSTSILRVLVHAGADLHTRNANGMTALALAATSPYRAAEKIEILINAGLDTEVPTRLGRTALMWAAIAGSAEAIEALVQAGANTEARDHAGWTPLMHASYTYENPQEKVAVLLDLGADGSVRSNGGQTAFELAADNHYLVHTAIYWRLNDAQY